MFKEKVKSSFPVLDFDIECRPLSWYGGDFVTKEITAIAAAFITDEPNIFCWLLGEIEPDAMLYEFAQMYDAAGMVTGHYIRGYDLPLVNTAMMEYGLAPLSPKYSQDTKLDLIKRHGASNSQENLAAALGVASPKVGMNQEDWRAANRLTPEGLEKTADRVVGDVIQHMEMRRILLERGMLGRPKLWSPSPSGVGGYTP